MKKPSIERIAHSCCRTLAVLAAALCAALAPSPSYAANLTISSSTSLTETTSCDTLTVNGGITLFVPTCTNAVESKASFPSLQDTQFLYCSRKAHQYSDRRQQSLLATGGKMRFDYANSTSPGDTLSPDTPYVFFAAPSVDDGQEDVAEKDKTWSLSGTVDGNDYISLSVGSKFFTPESNAYFCLFGSYDGSLTDDTSVANKATCRFYYFKVWDTKDKENLLCHIVPVYDEIEMEVGFYDLVAGRFLSVHGNALAYSLTQDEDWSDNATICPTNNTTIDLAGYSLAAPVSVVKNESSTVAGDEYRDLDFVTATGEQVVRITGFRIPGTAKVETKIRPNAMQTTTTLFISRAGSSSQTFSSFIYGDDSANYVHNLRFDFNNLQKAGTTALALGNDHVLVFDGSGPTWTVDGTAQTKQTGSNGFTSGGDLYLLNRGGSLYHPAFCRLYYFTVTTNNIALLDMRPVQRISDGVVGLYDTVSNAFYTSSLGAFPAPAAPQYANSSATISELKVGEAFIDGYTVVDCITTTNKAPHIDTGYIPNATDRIEIKASLAALNETTCLFSSRAGTSTQTFSVFYVNNSGVRFDFNNRQATAGFVPAVDEPFTAAIDGNAMKFYTNGVLFATSAASNVFTPSANMLIFATYKNDATRTPTSHPMGNIYWFKVTAADGTQKLDMVPVVRNSDGLPGLYDRVSRTFRPSTSGTDFVAGTQVGDGKLYVDADSAFDATEIAANIALVKNGESAFDGRGTTLAGTLKPVAGTIGGVVLQSGATLDLSALSDAFSLDDNEISFADNATITIDVGSRTVSSKTALVTWTTAPANIATLSFAPTADASRGFKVKSDGIYPAPDGMVILFR